MASNCQPIDVGTRLSNPIAIYFAWAWAKSAMRHGIQKKKKKRHEDTAKQQSPYPHPHPAQPYHMLPGCCNFTRTAQSVFLHVRDAKK